MSIGKITAAVVKDGARRGSRIALEWDDGYTGIVDLTPVIAAHKALAPLADADAFRDFQIAGDGWSIEWSCGVDFGSEQLHRWAREQAGEIMPARAFRAWMQRHDMTLDAAAQALGLSRRTIAYYLSEEQVIPKTVMLATEGYDGRRAA
ncbi:DUF2442 domain-containing protein [Parasphingopyxis algicola]|uniref:DUF2442 domain-containing protein n=1 Tax=Parasphingopyxis algicola TaxID=2026624 RepID=UPI00159FF844|nr:DUF2442 domain-containing protein [Parasphingopyxis algicola]QLC26117.1 DUF2442 domain-containing protein [Parasphingopyxis algicola]